MGKFCSDFAGLAEISSEGKKKNSKKVSGQGTGEKKKKKEGRRTEINLCFSSFF
jgi:hypothetical protein